MIGYSKTDQIKIKVESKTKTIKPGKKTKEWNATIPKLKRRFSKAGIETCEIRLAGCWNNKALSFAHIDKRRELKKEELEKVVLACIPCHQQVEKMPRLEMRKTLETIIINRKTKV